MSERHVLVVFTVPADEEVDGANKRRLLDWIDATLPCGTYEVRGDGLYVEPLPPAKYKSAAELNILVRSLAQRTLHTLDGLGLGHRGTLWEAWQELAWRDPLNDRIDEELRRKLERLQTLSEVIGKALGAIDSFDGAKRELDRVWEGVDRELDIDRAR